MAAFLTDIPQFAAQVLSAISIRPYRALVGNLPGTVTGAMFVIQADAVISEEHLDEMIMTDNPVEAGSQGAIVTDHAYRLPSELVLTYDWATASAQNTTFDPSFLTSLYQQMLSIEANKTLLQVFTGKRQYNNMLIRALATTTDAAHENVLLLRVSLREILIATTQTLTLPANVGSINNQSQPQNNAPIVPQGPVGIIPGNNFNPGGLTPSGS